MSKLKKALEKAKEDRDSKGQLTNRPASKLASELKDESVKDTGTIAEECLGLDVCYTETKVKKIDDRLLKKGKIFSLFHEYQITDQIKSIRTQIIDKLNEVSGNTLMVTSSNPGEGKTFTAINLGGREANPIMEWFFKRLGVIETLFTLMSLTIILFGTVLYEHWIVWAFVCLYTIVVINNLMAIRKL